MFRGFILNAAKYAPGLLGAVAWRPASVVFSLTNRCNCRCIMCHCRDFPQDAELTTSEIAGVLRQARSLGVSGCLFYGGEPMLRPDLADLVGLAHASGMRTAMITNGALIDASSAALLVRRHLDEVVVSLDARGSFHDEIRGVPGTFEKASAALDALLALRKDGLKVSIGSLLMRPTLEKERILDLIAWARERDVPVQLQLIDFSLFYYRSDNDELRDKLWISSSHWPKLDLLVDKLLRMKKEAPDSIINSAAAIAYIKTYFRDPRDKRLPCYRAYAGSAWVDAQGDVYACQGMRPLGNIRRNSLGDILSSASWRQTVRRMFKKDCPGCSCGYASNVDADLGLSGSRILTQTMRRLWTN